MLMDRSTHRKPPSYMPHVVGALLLLAGAGYWAINWRMEQTQLRHEMADSLKRAIGEGNFSSLQKALEELKASKFADHPDMTNIVIHARWTLWAGEGIGAPPNPAELDNVNLDSPTSLIVARAERDLQKRDLLGGLTFLKQAQEKYKRDAAIAEIKARYSLAQTEGDRSEGNGAITAYFDAITTYGKKDPDSLPLNQARIAVGYAKACELTNNLEGAINNYKDALAKAPDYSWAILNTEMTKIPFDADLATVDTTFDELKKKADSFSPRQRAAMYLGWARRNFDNYELVKGLEPLKQAVESDPTDVEAAYQLGQIYLDGGKLAQAKELLDKAKKIAPMDERVYLAQSTLLLWQSNASEAQKMLDELLDPYNKYKYAKIAKARIQRQSNAITDAVTEVAGVVERNPQFFEGKLEQALLTKDEAGKDPVKMFTDLTSLARASGRPAAATVMQAYTARYTTTNHADAVSQAQGQAEADMNAWALLVLAEGEIQAGNRVLADTMLAKAKEFGDLPQIAALVK